MERRLCRILEDDIVGTTRALLSKSNGEDNYARVERNLQPYILAMTILRGWVKPRQIIGLKNET